MIKDKGVSRGFVRVATLHLLNVKSRSKAERNTLVFPADTLSPECQMLPIPHHHRGKDLISVLGRQVLRNNLNQ